jgi:hypothetical protein
MSRILLIWDYLCGPGTLRSNWQQRIVVRHLSKEDKTLIRIEKENSARTLGRASERIFNICAPAGVCDIEVEVRPPDGPPNNPRSGR